jgi:hypothetical protein
MVRIYDLYREDQMGTPIWLERVAESELQKRLLRLSFLKPGKYRVYDSKAGKFVETFKQSA